MPAPTPAAGSSDVDLTVVHAPVPPQPTMPPPMPDRAPAYGYPQGPAVPPGPAYGYPQPVTAPEQNPAP